MALGKNVAGSLACKEYFEGFDYIFSQKYFQKSESVSIADKYKISIDYYNHSYMVTKNSGYSISCQYLALTDIENQLLYSYKNVFGKLFYHYLAHSNGNEYLMCGLDLMEFSIYNISKNDESRFVSICRVDDDSGDDCQNEFWYITTLLYNPSNNFVAINGQDGMNCATVTLCDFSDPDDFSSIKAISLGTFVAEKYDDPTCIALEWNENNDLLLNVCEEDGKDVLLSEKEILELFVN